MTKMILLPLVAALTLAACDGAAAPPEAAAPAAAQAQAAAQAPAAPVPAAPVPSTPFTCPAQGDPAAVEAYHGDAYGTLPDPALEKVVKEAEATLRRYEPVGALEADLDAGVAAHPTDVRLLVVTSWYKGRLAKPADARALLEKAAALGPEHPYVLLGQGQVALDEHKLAQALPLYEKVLAADPTNFIALHSTAFIELERQKGAPNPQGMAQAISTLQKAIAIDPWSARPPFLLGEAYMSMGRFDDAGRVLACAVSFIPGSVDLRMLGAAAAGRGGHFKEAIPILQSVLALAPAHPTARALLPYTMARAGDLAGGEAEALKAQEMLPQSADIGWYMARGYGFAGDEAGAVRWLGKAISLSPQMKVLARTEPAFSSIRGGEAFMALVAP